MLKPLNSVIASMALANSTTISTICKTLPFLFLQVFYWLKKIDHPIKVIPYFIYVFCEISIKSNGDILKFLENIFFYLIKFF